MVATTELVLVCQAAAETVSPCPSGFAPTTVQGLVLSPSTLDWLTAAVEPIDYTQAAALLSTVVGTCVLLFLTAYAISRVVSVVH